MNKQTTRTATKGFTLRAPMGGKPTMLQIFNCQQRAKTRREDWEQITRLLAGLSARQVMKKIKHWEERGQMFRDMSSILRTAHLPHLEFTEDGFGIMGYVMQRWVRKARRILKFMPRQLTGEGRPTLARYKVRPWVKGLEEVREETARMN